MTHLSLNGSSEIVIASTGTSNYPAGLFFDSHYAPRRYLRRGPTMRKNMTR